jgi:hypothetical protein
MSGGASVPFAIAAVFAGENYQRQLLWAAALVCFIIAAYRVWSGERSVVIQLQRGVDREAARAMLAAFRTEGVGLRNDGNNGFFEDSSWEQWEQDLIAWRDKVHATIRSISEADAEMWMTLDEVPPARFKLDSIFSTNHYRHIHAMHDFRIVKLEKLNYRYGISQ